MAYSQSWLESTSRRCILVEATINKIGTGTTTLYFSTSGYITTSSDVFYPPLVSGGLKYTESLALSNTISMTYGDVQLNNQDGSLDTYLDGSQYIWANGSIVIYYGDPTWVSTTIADIHTNFLKIFNGVISDIDTKDRSSINIKLVDKLQRLNTPLTDSKLGTYGYWGTGGQTNADSIIPLVFGEVFNMTPMLIDPVNRQYYINRGVTEELIELRDNGVPISSYTFDSTTGKITTTSPVVGTLTASLKGIRASVAFTNSSAALVSSYSNNMASIIALIVSQYGNSLTALNLSTDIDFVNFNSFSTTNTQPIGIVISDRQNTLQVCNSIADCIDAQLFCTRAGLLQILTLGRATSTSIVPSVTITTSDIINPTLSIHARTPIVAATKIGYAKNWTVQPGLITSIPQAHKDNYATEYLTTTSTNTTVRTNYKLMLDPIQKDTLLIVNTDAVTEASRLNSYYNVVHTVFGFTGTSKLLSLQLGQKVTLVHPRFQLSAGVDCQVITLSPDWTKGTVDIEVITL